MESKNKISPLTRGDIADWMSLEKVNWAGRNNEPDFLLRIYNLKSMPSTDCRYSDAYDDIWQHTVNNDDYESNWIFMDSRINLMHCEDEFFLKFFCEILHPVVRPDMNEVWKLYEHINSYLKLDGFQLVEAKRISGKPVFSWKETNSLGNPVIPIAKNDLSKIDDSYVSQKLSRMESAIEHDPSLAIGTAKELVETICKTIIAERTTDKPLSEKLPRLVRQTAELLSLTPEGIPDKAKAAGTIKMLLGSLSSITQGMAELRNSYGTGHGREAGLKGLSTRHAKLAVGAASTLAIFLWDTHKEKKQNV